MFNIGDLVSWRKTKELAIVVDIHNSVFSQSGEILVKFVGDDAKSREIFWYDSRYFEKVHLEK